jgi:hypothetical protein
MLVGIDTNNRCQSNYVYAGSRDWYFISVVFVKQKFMYKVQRFRVQGSEVSSNIRRLIIAVKSEMLRRTAYLYPPSL